MTLLLGLDEGRREKIYENPIGETSVKVAQVTTL